jgi:arginyl-tRNA synthetase
LHYYYESNTYLLGKDVVQIGLIKAFSKRSRRFGLIDLTDEGLDRKIVLRSDGTAVYDAGYWNGHSACKDYPDVRNGLYGGNEQDYHFKVLF